MQEEFDNQKSCHRVIQRIISPSKSSSQQSSSEGQRNQSSSHQIFYQTKQNKKSKKIRNNPKNKKRNAKNKNRQKTEVNSNRLSNTQKKTVSGQSQLLKNNKTLFDFSFSQENHKNQQFCQSKGQSQNIPQFQLTYQQRNLFNHLLKQTNKGFSIQSTQLIYKIKTNDNYKVFQKEKQFKISSYFQKKSKSKAQQQNYKNLISQQKLPSFSNFLAKAILQQLSLSDNTDDFFKYKIEDLIKKSILFKRYDNFIQEALDLQTLQQQINKGQNINNLFTFQFLFEQMLHNSFLLHKHLKDQKMLIKTDQMWDKYFQMSQKYTHSQVDELNKSKIKVTTKPKSHKVSLGQQKKNIEYLDLDDTHNINRIKVMNIFLKRIFQENKDQIFQMTSRIKNLIQSSTDDKVELIQYYEAQDHVSRISISSSDTFHTNYCQIKANEISLELFSKLKHFIQKKIRDNKKKTLKGQNIDEFCRKKLYPHDDSSGPDFQSSDDS